MNEKQRDEFEKWYKENINRDGPFLGCKEAFRSEHAAISAKAWQAAIASVVVEIPSFFSDRYETDIIFSDDMEKVLNKAGIRYE